MSDPTVCTDCADAPLAPQPQPASRSAMAQSASSSTSTFGTLAGPESKGGAGVGTANGHGAGDGTAGEAVFGESEAAGTSGSGTKSASDGIAKMVAPPIPFPFIVIEFCDRCRWAPRAAWTQTELFLTFPTPTLKAITLMPLTSPETGGRFRVWVDRGHGGELVWDRKSEGGFPELKVLKQRIRNLIQPDQDLGHSDVHTHTSSDTPKRHVQAHQDEAPGGVASAGA